MAAIKIPKDQKQTVNLPSTNLLDRVPNAIAPAFDKLTNFLDVVSERKKANDRRIEEKRIRDKNSYWKSILDLNGKKFIEEEINPNKEILTPKGYDLLLNDYQKKQKEIIKIAYKNDPNALADFKSDEIGAYAETYKNLKEARNLKVIADGRIVFDTGTQTTNTRIEDLANDDFYWNKVDQVLSEEKKRWSNGLVEYGVTQIGNWKDREETLTLLAWKKEVEAGKVYDNPVTQVSEPDNLAIYSSLISIKDGVEKYFWHGKPMPNHIYTELVKYYKSQADSQKKIANDYKERKHNEVYKEYIFDLIEIKRGTPKSAALLKTFVERVQNDQFLNDDKKKILVENLLKWQKNTPKLYNTQAGTNATILADILVYNGLIDTKTESSFIDELYSKELISEENWTQMKAKIEDNVKVRNMKKTSMFKNAIAMIGSEIGKPDLMKLLEATSSEDNDDVLLALGANLDQETYNALNYFKLVLAAGEKQGYSYEGMLIKGANDKEYVLDDLLQYLRHITFTGEHMPNVLGSWNMLKSHPSFETGYNPNKPFSLAPEIWFAEKQPVGLDFDVPKRNANESVSAWINRTMTHLIKNKEVLPSTITGFQFEEDADLNNIFIVPKIEE